MSLFIITYSHNYHQIFCYDIHDIWYQLCSLGYLPRNLSVLMGSSRLHSQLWDMVRTSVRQHSHETILNASIFMDFLIIFPEFNSASIHSDTELQTYKRNYKCILSKQHPGHEAFYVQFCNRQIRKFVSLGEFMTKFNALHCYNHFANIIFSIIVY